MEDIRYILGEPIEIESVGTLYPLNILEYIKYQKLFNVLQVTVKLLLQQVENKEDRKKIKQLKDFDIICRNSEYLQGLLALFSVCFKENLTSSNIKIINNELKIILKNGVIDRDNYGKVKGEIAKMYYVKLPKQASTKELQKWYDKAYKYKNSQSKQDLEDTITTVIVFTGYTPSQIKNMTLYQINAILNRISVVENYKSGLIPSLLNSKIKIEPYFAHIDLFKEDKISTDFNKQKQYMKNFMKA